MSGESFLQAHWVAVPKAMRARRINRRADSAERAMARKLFDEHDTDGERRRWRRRRLPMHTAHTAQPAHQRGRAACLG
jgi:hypothetical protein